MRIIAIDTGTLKTAAVLIDSETKLPLEAIWDKNEIVLDWLQKQEADEVCIEVLTSYGMAGETVFTSQLWVGIFWGVGLMLGMECSGIHRKVAVKHLCGNANAGDKGVRSSLIGRYGHVEGCNGLGSKKNPGPITMLGNCHKQAAHCIGLAHIEGAKHVDLCYSISAEKKERDQKKRAIRSRKLAREAARGEESLKGKLNVFTKKGDKK